MRLENHRQSTKVPATAGDEKYLRKLWHRFGRYESSRDGAVIEQEREGGHQSKDGNNNGNLSVVSQSTGVLADTCTTDGVEEGEGGLTDDPAGRYRVLAIVTLAVVLGLATWFSATAVRCEIQWYYAQQ